MSGKRKISVRKILQLLVTIIVTTGCIAAVSTASKNNCVKKVAGIDMKIKNDKYSFVDKDEIKRILLSNRHINLNRARASQLNIYEMEKIILANPWIENAQVYIDNKKVLHVNIVQRVPIARLFEQNGNSYYIDANLKSMPLSSRYTHYSTVVTNVPVLKDDSLGESIKYQIAFVVKKIENDKFWNAQVSQIIFTDKNDFELVPVLGKQRILLGDTTGIEEKLGNLLAFYTKILNRIGWDKYEVLDARYDGQIVASPSLPWKKPGNEIMSNMNWIKTLIDTDEKSAEPDTPKYTVVNNASIVQSTEKRNVSDKINEKNKAEKELASNANDEKSSTEDKTPKYIYKHN